MINRERLANSFMSLVKIDSISKEELNMSKELQKILEPFDAEIIIDNAGERIKSNTGNLIAKFKGNIKAPPILLGAHMDTVEPGRGIKPIFDGSVFKSDGTTILGADDKSAIAIFIEILKVITENNLPHPPIELVFTVCEEIGLQGAKNFDFTLIESKLGYILDSTDTEGIVLKAPQANWFEFTVYGKEAHAGASPEKGINAIALASKAIAKLSLGRIDDETTLNIGKINGGIATNVVPNLVKIEGEARSHNPEKLKQVTDEVIKVFSEIVDNNTDNKDILPRVEIKLRQDFPATNIPEDHSVITLAKKASKNLGRKLESKTIGGGADANIFCSKDIMIGVIGTGMRDVHTLKENIKLDDMVLSAELILEIIKIYAQENEEPSGSII